MKTNQIIKQFSPLLQESTKLFNITSMSVGIIIGDEIRFVNIGNTSEGDDARSVDEKTIYRIGSISKAFWKPALQRLLGAQFDPNSRLADFSKYPIDGALRESTINQILSHTTGLAPLCGSLQAFLGIPISSSSIHQMAFNANPDQKHQYNNIAFHCLANLMNNMYPLGWKEYFESQLFIPLGMVDTSFNKPKHSIVAAPYTEWNGVNVLVDKEPFADILSPAAGSYSTCSDLVKFVQGQMQSYTYKKCDPPIPTSIIFDIMDEHYQSTRYADGRFYKEFKSSRKISVNFIGGIPGYSSLAAFSPSDKVGLVILSNKMNVSRIFEYLFFELICIASGLQFKNLLHDIYMERKNYDAILLKKLAFKTDPIQLSAFERKIEDRKYGMVHFYACHQQMFMKFGTPNSVYRLYPNRNTDSFILGECVTKRCGRESFTTIFPKIEIFIDGINISWKIHMSNSRGGTFIIEEHEFGPPLK